MESVTAKDVVTRVPNHIWMRSWLKATKSLPLRAMEVVQRLDELHEASLGVAGFFSQRLRAGYRDLLNSTLGTRRRERESLNHYKVDLYITHPHEWRPNGGLVVCGENQMAVGEVDDRDIPSRLVVVGGIARRLLNTRSNIGKTSPFRGVELDLKNQRIPVSRRAMTSASPDADRG